MSWSVPQAIIPEWVLDAAISDKAVRLYLVLARYGGTSQARFPSRPTIAARLGCDTKTVDRAMKELVDIGAVQVTPRFRENGGRSSNAYKLLVEPPGWAGAGDTGDPGEAAEMSPAIEDSVNTPTDTPSLTGQGAADPSTAILRAWWDELVAAGEPTPAQPWPAMLQVVRAMLKAGHSEARVAWALRNSPTVSTAALTLAINRRLGKGARRSSTATALDMMGVRR